MNFAGIGWTNVQALRQRGVDARLVVFNTQPAHPEADEDLNLPYLGVRHALGELSFEELQALRPRIRPGRTALRFFDQVEWDGG